MRYLVWLIGILAALVATVYVIVFTPFGNGLLGPMVEGKIQEQTKFESRLKTFTLSMSEIDILLELNTNNTISVKGNYSLFSKDLDVVYAVKLEKLSTLKSLTGTELNGALHVDGTVKGALSLMQVDGQSDLAGSDTKFEASIKNFNPATVKVTIDNLSLKNLFHMLNQPHYTDGVFSLNADINDARSGSLKGKIATSIKKGLLNSKYIIELAKFKSPMPSTTFNSITTTTLNGNILDTKVDLNSNIANLDIKSAKFNIQDSSINSDYKVKISNLDKLYFVTGQHMKGGITVNGELFKTKDLDLTIHTKVAGGNIDAVLHNDDFHAEFKSVETIGLLHMLIYPELFKSNLDGKLNYNLASAKGDFVGQVIDGNFAKNKTFNLVKQYTKFDMYRESFNGYVGANINKENILASLNLYSTQASIKTKDTKLNTKTQKIDSDITIQVKKNTITANIKGDINSPKVKVDLEKLIKLEAGKKVKEEINKFLKKLF